MPDKRFDLPGIDQTLDPKVRRPLERMKQALQQLLGYGGNPLDAALTLRKAVATGLTDADGAPIGSGTGGSTEPDLTPAPTATGLIATPGSTVVIVEWDAPTYTQGRGHGQTNVYAVKRDPASVDPLPTFVDAVQVYTAPDGRTIADLPSEPNVQWHIWIKWQTADGVESSAPTGGTNGETVTTVQIGEEQLGANAVTDAKVANLSASKLTVGDGSVGGNLKSTLYTSGLAGWILRPNGTVEFNNVTARGAIYATSGEFGGVSIVGALTMGTAGLIKGGQTAYNTGTGFFLGYSGADYKFSLGNSTESLTWDGSALTIKGTLAVGSSPAISGTTMTGSGAAVNANGTFALGDSTTNIVYDGAVLTLNGEVAGATNLKANSASLIANASAGAWGLVSVTLTVTADDIPAGETTVPIVITGSVDAIAVTFFDIGYNQSPWTSAGNLVAALPPQAGVQSYTVVYDAVPGTYTFGCFNHGAGNAADVSNTRGRTITAEVVKR